MALKSKEDHFGNESIVLVGDARFTFTVACTVCETDIWRGKTLTPGRLVDVIDAHFNECLSAADLRESVWS